MAHPDRLIRKALRTRYLITLTSGDAFDGILLEADERHYVLVDAEQILPDRSRVKVDGELWLPRLNVDYLQKP